MKSLDTTFYRISASSAMQNACVRRSTSYLQRTMGYHFQLINIESRDTNSRTQMVNQDLNTAQRSTIASLTVFGCPNVLSERNWEPLLYLNAIRSSFFRHKPSSRAPVEHVWKTALKTIHRFIPPPGCNGTPNESF